MLVFSRAMPANQETNPLLEIQFRIPFDRIRAEHVEPAIEELLRDARAKLEALAADTGPHTFENTMLAYEAITECRKAIATDPGFGR